MKRLLITAAAAGLAAPAMAQYADSAWPSWRGGPENRASVEAPGPATSLAFEVADVPMAAVGGFTFDTDGDVYYKSRADAGVQVFRLDPATGAVLASTAVLPSNGGAYAGVAVGTDALYTCLYNGAEASSVLKLDKDTLAIIAEWDLDAFIGLRGTPLIGSVPNARGNVNLYVSDRNGAAIHAIDSVTGDLEWTYSVIYDTPFGMIGPQWVDAGTGRDRIAYFGNGALGPGAVLEDNGDGTFDIVWDAAGPESFNWYGSGVLSEDGDNIYVTTFNDGDVESLWSIDAATGDVLWSVPGLRGTPEELNFFSRPAAVGNRVYCFGGFGVVATFDDNGSSYTPGWEYRSGVGEYTAGSVAVTPGGDTYVYAVRQGNPDPAAFEPAQFLVLKDNGADFEVILETTLGDTMIPSLFGNNSAAIDADGSVWVGSGRDTAVGLGSIYKFAVDSGCYADCDGSGELDFFDFLCFQNAFATGDPYADCDGTGVLDFFDFLCFQNEFAAGCP
ncbi:MAG: GC-type dockerin domain-anchored protein [Phycisphaerales bacterium JB039]